MIDRNETAAFVRLQGHNFRARMRRYYDSSLEPKIARTFTDDVDFRRGALPMRCTRYRPGLRDDEASCEFNNLQTVR